MSNKCRLDVKLKINTITPRRKGNKRCKALHNMGACLGSPKKKRSLTEKGTLEKEI